ncbi:molybdate ABC transporter permease subunit [Arenicella xantha]|uniref:Molybdenum transport system permease n=1 Tax=Arenicella xantha TaxID=644221 RepID=A0A395JI45_9GAMM|nr:molybdate ABC transporter permease subunit [Arenicella xantha]RBP49695.1 molybdate transport system permease protein [Arenicella xantha]
MLSPADYAALFLTLKLAALSTTILLLLGTPLAWWLSVTRWRGKFLIEALVAIPLVLPPTVLGFYLLVAFSPNQWLGQLYQSLTGAPLAFSFTGLVLGSVLYSLPFVVQPLQNAFSAINANVLDAAATLRASPLDRFYSVAVPLARPGFISAAVLGFAHTLGEFGVVLMIGGNIPGETQVASIAIYEHVETLAFAEAHRLSMVLLGLSLILLMTVYAGNKRRVLRL